MSDNRQLSNSHLFCSRREIGSTEVRLTELGRHLVWGKDEDAPKHLVESQSVHRFSISFDADLCLNFVCFH